MQSVKLWAETAPIIVSFTGQFPEIDPVVLQLLVNRGVIDTTQAPSEVRRLTENFLQPDWQTQVHEPSLFSQMTAAVLRVLRAVKEQEKICVFGDYDADGVCGAAIIYSVLERLGARHVKVYIPHREDEGYGLNEPALHSLINEGTTLIITVDLGVSNQAEINLAEKRGVSVVVVDHHEIVDDLPKATAIIHAGLPGETYPFKHLSGAGTAFKLGQALLEQSAEASDAFAKWLLDLTAIGTVADVVPLVGENRVLVKYGLVVLNKTQRPGLQQLIGSAGLRRHGRLLEASNIAWQLAPRLNAAGRVYHAREALMLLLEKDEAKAKELAGHLNDINYERQQIAEQVFKEALEQLGEGEDMILTAFKPSWPLGLLGLVAGKISNKFYRPTILLTEAQGKIVGSGRSIAELDITRTLAQAKDLLIRFGGHPGACGLSLEKDKLSEFKQKLEKLVTQQLTGKKLQPRLEVDAELELADITSELAELLEQFQPFGQGNPKPKFMTRHLRIELAETVGNHSQHLKLLVADESGIRRHKVIGFGRAQLMAGIKVGDIVDIVFELSFNNWNEQRELQLKLIDLRKSYY